MANIKSNIKTKRQSDKKHKSNKAKISTLKGSVKKARTTNDSKDLKVVYKNADSLSRKRVIHRNRANRIKSRTAKAMNKSKKSAK